MLESHSTLNYGLSNIVPLNRNGFKGQNVQSLVWKPFIIRDNSIAQHIAIPEFISQIYSSVKSICEIKLSILHEPFDCCKSKQGGSENGSHRASTIKMIIKKSPFLLDVSQKFSTPPTASNVDIKAVIYIV